MTPEQTKAIEAVPDCVEMEQLDGTWEHVVFRVEHPVTIFLDEGPDVYTRREARSCQRWLRKHAPESDYAEVKV